MTTKSLCRELEKQRQRAHEWRLEACRLRRAIEAYQRGDLTTDALLAVAEAPEGKRPTGRRRKVAA